MSDALETRIRLMISRGEIALVDDSKGAQSVQVELLDEEVQGEVERFQQYGLSSVPHPDAEAVIVCIGGLRSHSIVIATEDRRYRLKGLESGEVALYDDLGQVVHLARDGIRIETDQRVTVNADSVEVNAESVVVNSDDVNLGAAGGAAVARVGDTVSGGVITSGSSKVSAA